MSGTTRITGIATIAVPVTDQDRALEFYLGRLGFETRRDLYNLYPLLVHVYFFGGGYVRRVDNTLRSFGF